MYAKIDVTLASHKKTRRLARLLGCSVPTAIGHLALLWIDCLNNSPDGDITDRGTLEIAEAALWPGSDVAFLEALIETGFADRNADGEVDLHDWYDHTGKYLYKKEGTRKRVQKLREERRKDVTRTEALQSPAVTRTEALQSASALQCEVSKVEFETEVKENSTYSMNNTGNSESDSENVTRYMADVTRTKALQSANVTRCNAPYEKRKEEKRSNSNTFPAAPSEPPPSGPDLPGAFAPGENGGNPPVVDSNGEGGDTGTKRPSKNRQRAENSEKQDTHKNEASKKEKPTNEPWDAYAKAWTERYGKPPTRSGMSNAHIAKLLNLESREYIIKFLAWYPTSRRAFEIKTTHSLSTILANFDTLRIYFETGVNPDDVADRATKNRREGNALRKKLRDSGCSPVPF
jgi:hypothetical protein